MDVLCFCKREQFKIKIAASVVLNQIDDCVYYKVGNELPILVY